jgi:hypothetical protein
MGFPPFLKGIIKLQGQTHAMSEPINRISTLDAGKAAHSVANPVIRWLIECKKRDSMFDFS